MNLDAGFLRNVPATALKLPVTVGSDHDHFVAGRHKPPGHFIGTGSAGVGGQVKILMEIENSHFLPSQHNPGHGAVTQAGHR